eukprot:scaffold655475_cov79-Prasinocladus_malaysianus.AAC.1
MSTICFRILSYICPISHCGAVDAGDDVDGMVNTVLYNTSNASVWVAVLVLWYAWPGVGPGEPWTSLSYIQLVG